MYGNRNRGDMNRMIDNMREKNVFIKNRYKNIDKKINI